MSRALGWIWACWAALLVLLATTTGLAFLPLGRWNLVVAIAIASLKALIVVIVFMELRRSSGLVRVFAGAGFLWLMILLGLTGADYANRHEAYIPNAFQRHELPAKR
ncbi:caa(3)-type oxidase subunit IV [Sphingomonas sp. MAH-20]|uniref:Caa(3)-type oxidase subunit IV n=1 Tax=Sphingomonas horti TaxID=2682842 RepID=A0A6I4J146_9SPHN|nr:MULTISPECIES: cytochrome C oxidase subunit IV family protein [Sphingomonas]MBA2919452.1 cytochrome C oxidase subunit IV family protein [Sphingomonas sp. CGMCC 1.13658]MVO78332.1 caa(3)-type oxidase subunit IV [Sphingomonas horti]